MREYMTNLAAVMMIIALANMILPSGSIKKFTSLATGFMLICAAVAPLPSKFDDISFSAETFDINDEQIASAEAEYKKMVMNEHRRNLKELIESRMKHGSKANVQVSEDGEIVGVHIMLRGDESTAVNYIVNTLQVPRERIKLNYENN